MVLVGSRPVWAISEQAAKITSGSPCGIASDHPRKHVPLQSRIDSEPFRTGSIRKVNAPLPRFAAPELRQPAPVHFGPVRNAPSEEVEEPPPRKQPKRGQRVAEKPEAKSKRDGKRKVRGSPNARRCQATGARRMSGGAATRGARGQGLSFYVRIEIMLLLRTFYVLYASM